MIVAWAAAAFAGAPADPAMDMLGAAIDRHRAELRLPGAPPLHHLRYRYIEQHVRSAEASFGGIRDLRDDHTGWLGVEVRVGTPEFDSGSFGGFDTGFNATWVGPAPSGDALGWAAWRLTDQSYKAAVEQYARKQAQFRPPEGYPGDYILLGATTADLGTAPPQVWDPRAIATEVSSVYLAYPRFDIGETHAAVTHGTERIADSEGTRVRQPDHGCVVRSVARVRAADGTPLTSDRLWWDDACERLPPVAALRSEVAASAAELDRAAASPAWTRDYVGPVLFEGDAAADLFRYLLLPEVEGTPPAVSFETWLGDLGSGGGGRAVMGRRLLPEGWTARDVPLSPYDAEGTPTSERTVITDGVVRDLLMSRVPRRDRAKPGGNARGSLGEPPAGRAGRLFVEPPRVTRGDRLVRRAIRSGANYGCRCVVIVRRLQDPEAMGVDADAVTPDTVGPLPPPLYVVLRHDDGREETFHGARFSGANRFVLRDIQGASASIERSFLAPLSSAADWGYTGVLDGLPTRITAPAVWIGEMELVPSPGDVRDLPILPLPSPGNEDGA